MDVADRVVVVTGGARGIGRALARRFASSGAAHVVVADIGGDGAATAAQEVGGSGIRCDRSAESDVRSLLERIEADHGRIDIFCSNAGIAAVGGPEADYSH